MGGDSIISHRFFVAKNTGYWGIGYPFDSFIIKGESAMYHSILVPLDGSEMAESILDHVHDLARMDQAKVTLLQVEEAPLMLGRDEVIDTNAYKKHLKKRKKRVKSYLLNLVENLRESGIEAHYKIGYGPVIKSIMDIAEEEKADLIAMATHGFVGLSRSIYGSVAAGLVQRVHCPILITRRNGND